jgi:hypothetical protein
MIMHEYFSMLNQIMVPSLPLSMRMILLQQKIYEKLTSLQEVRHGLLSLKYGTVVCGVIWVFFAWHWLLRNIIVPMKVCSCMSQKIVQPILNIVDGQGVLGVLLPLPQVRTVNSAIWYSRPLQNVMKLYSLRSAITVESRLKSGMAPRVLGEAYPPSVPLLT